VDDAKRKVDLNALLMAANLVMLGLIVFEAFRLRDNIYVNEQSLLLGALLCVQTQIALMLERLRRDPFVILLTFSMIFYYELRIFTLAVYEYSDVFPRYPFNADDTNFALFYMLIANLCLYGGLFSIKTKPGNLAIKADGWKATSAGRVVIVLLAGIVFSYLGGSLWTEGGMPRAINFVVLLLSPSMLILMVLAYYILYRKTLGHTAAVTIMILILLEVVAHTLAGSRSAIVGLVQTALLVMLAISGRIKFDKRFVLLGIVTAPVLVGLMIATFAISSYNRFARVSGAAPDLERAAEFVAASTNDPLIVARLGIIAPAIASRAGFFDFSAEIIAHRDEYASVMNGATYFRSIIDNVLTPGTDVFDQPKIANSLIFVYRRWGTPAKSYVSEAYQSDQIGIHGEFFVVFGWVSLPLLFMLTFLLKHLYVRASSPNPYIFAMKRIVLLFVFVRSIESFGMDWTVTEIVPLIMAIFVYSKFFTSRPIVTPERGQPPYAPAL
jgi:hypothetical protein